MFNLGSLTYKIEVDAKGAEKELNQFDKSVQKGTKSTQGLGKAASAAGGLFTAAFVAAIAAGAAKIGKHLIKMSSDAEEVGNKFDVTFRDVAASADQAAKDLAKGYGLSQKASKALLADTGDLLSGFGFTGEAALDMSTEVNKLAVDLASFTNYSGGAEGASAALTKGLLGERESMKSLGIAITEADIKQLAEDKGIVGEIDRQTKAMLTLELAMQQSKNAIGDFERSQDSFANQMRVAQANVDDLSVVFGDILLPIAGVAVSLFNDFTSELTGAGEALREFVGQADNAKKVGDAIGTVAGYLTTVKDLGTEYLKDIGDAFKLILQPIFSLGGELDVVSLALQVMSVWFKILGNVMKIVGSILGAIIGNTISTGQAIVEVVKSFKSLATVIEGIKTGNLDLVKEGVEEIGKTSFDELMAHTGRVIENYKKVGETAVEGFNEVKTAIQNVGEVEKKYNESKDKASKRTADGLLNEQKAYEDALTARKNAAEEGAKTEEDATETLEDELAKREAAIKQFIGNVANLMDTYGSSILSFSQSIGDTQDNLAQTAINNQGRDLEIKKQIWDKEAEAKIAQLNKQEMGEEAYAKAVEEINEENKRKQLEADYEYEMAKYEAEKDAFERKKALSIAEVWINTSVAIMRAFAENYWPVALGISAAATAVGIAQTAAIATQPPPVAPIKPAFGDGAIVSNPGPGIDATVGEVGPEAIIPLNQDTLSMLGNAIASATQATTSATSQTGQVINLIVEGMGRATIALTQEALDNREIRVPATAIA